MEDSYENYRRGNSRNVLGIIGFVLSLLCIPAILGLLFSLIAVRKQPRGFAIAGIIIGLIWVGLQAFVFIAAQKLVEESRWQSLGNFIEYAVDLGETQKAVNQFIMDKGEEPRSSDVLDLKEENKTDPWGHPYRLRRVEGTNGRPGWLIFSPGPDGKWKTADDPMAGLDPENRPRPLEEESPVDPTPSSEEEGR